MITYGNVLVSENNKKMHTDFIADVYILHHQTTITQKVKKNDLPIIHTNGVRQAAEIIKYIMIMAYQEHMTEAEFILDFYLIRVYKTKVSLYLEKEHLAV